MFCVGPVGDVVGVEFGEEEEGCECVGEGGEVRGGRGGFGEEVGIGFGEEVEVADDFFELFGVVVVIVV